MTNKKTISTKTMTIAAILTALVVLLQFIGQSIRLGPFMISLVLVPIVVGAAVCGAGIGAWLGFVFGFVVLISGDATAFLAINVFGTIVTVILKGTLCGLCAGLVYKLLEKKNTTLAVTLSAVTAPVVNTGVFLLGCSVFFLDTINEWSAAAGSENVFSYMILVLVGGNFLVELAIDLLLSPIIVRVISIAGNRFSR